MLVELPIWVMLWQVVAVVECRVKVVGNIVLALGIKQYLRAEAQHLLGHDFRHYLPYLFEEIGNVL
jgi:hypothetical protein